MQKSIWKALVLFLTLAALCQQVSATPIVTQLGRLVQASAGPNGPSDPHSSTLPGPVDWNASVSFIVPVGDAGSDFVNATSSQQSTIDAFGFSYTSTIHIDGFSHGILSPQEALAADAWSRFGVT